ncbi:hypothetical protein B296_00029346 [Ensete ventricosum]|uniref:Uncharacterized protein n=1 Tax=Ensete ventricosum TaxID=4639 RepID=A0A427AL49_ENSVE|nr:hypothetical protein B296_00029346 [Ensete ventricosum]
MGRRFFSPRKEKKLLAGDGSRDAGRPSDGSCDAGRDRRRPLVRTPLVGRRFFSPRRRKNRPRATDRATREEIHVLLFFFLLPSAETAPLLLFPSLVPPGTGRSTYQSAGGPVGTTGYGALPLFIPVLFKG